MTLFATTNLSRHVSAPYHAHEPRRQALMIFEPGKYEKFSAKDPRVRGV